jgi:hypothetical protein
LKFPFTQSNHRSPLRALLVLGALGLLSACSSSNNDGETDEGGTSSSQFAYIATRSADAGQIERYSLADNTLVSTYPGTLDDIDVATDGSDIYQIGRRNLDSITKFDATDSSQTLFQYSVNGDEEGANPYTVVFANDTKAYVIRYGSSKVWIINPSAQTEAEFKIGELDLTAYDSTGEPNANDAVIVGDKLFILMERLNAAFEPDVTGYVAVFDTTDDSAIDTQMGEDGLLGIKLNTTNPGSIQYLEASDEIYVTGRGNLYNEFNTLTDDPYQGGIETIDPETYALDMLIDDGTADNNQGFFVRAIIVSPTVGYIATYDDSVELFSERDTLRVFNPTTGIMADDPVSEFVNTSIGPMAVAPNGNLWIPVPGNTPGDGSGYYQLDTGTNSIVGELLATQLAPINVVFLDVTAP